MLPHALSLTLLATTMMACTKPGPREPPDYGTTKTDTFPQFYGWVPKNLLMISMDTFRKDHLDRYGVVNGVSPFLTAVAAQGFVADEHVQCSNWTFAAVSCTLLGRQNEEAGLIPQLITNFDMRWPVGTDFLSTYLQDAGFYGIVASTNGWFGPNWNNTDGYAQAFHPAVNDTWGVYQEARRRLDDVLRNREAERWFLHLHLTEPHASYDPPPRYLAGLDDLEPVPWDLTDRDEQYEVSRALWPSMTQEEQDLLEAHLRVRYKGEIRHMDDQLFSVIADMDFDGLLDDTLVVFWTDHGEQFWEHGYQTHAYSLTREENDGILFMWSKNIIPASWTGPTQATDLVPTLLPLYGLPIPDAVTGIPIGQADPSRPRFAHTVARLGTASSVNRDGFKLVFSWLGTVRMYDLVADPQEQVDLYDPGNLHPMTLTLWADLVDQVVIQSALLPDTPVNWPDGLPAP